MSNSQDLGGDVENLKQNLERIEVLNNRFLAALAKKKATRPEMMAPGQEFYMKAMTAYMSSFMGNPSKVLEQQVNYWGKSLELWMNLQGSGDQAGGSGSSGAAKTDRRFRSELWDSHPFFSLAKQQYLLTGEAVETALEGMEGVNANDKKRIEFFARQIVDMMSPANFLGTNPEALQRALETNGESLVRGLENLVRDVEKSDGELLITLSDPEAFKIGENLASTEGGVVYRNELFELIQYSPRTESVRRIPLLIVPPWINKYYILDLRPDNSFVRWAVDQGFTVFVMSWVNPGPEHRDFGMDSYAETGCMAAIREVLRVTGENQLNAVGYCIGGTLLAMVLAYMGKKGDRSVRSATFLTTLTDFSDTGQMSVFLEEDFVSAIEREVKEKGVLPSHYMSRTFSYMRANDLVYGPAVRSYMMGEAPPAFDLLYWNGDSTNLPGRMAVEYLRGLCKENRFSNGTLDLLGENIALRDVRHPFIAVTCEADHIADWQNSYRGIRHMGSRSKSFILSESGHTAGVINPPTKKKYGHYSRPDMAETAQLWREGAEFYEGSWWTRWAQWLGRRSGAKVVPRQLGGESGKVLCAAPGTYIAGTAKF